MMFEPGQRARRPDRAREGGHRSARRDRRDADDRRGPRPGRRRAAGARDRQRRRRLRLVEAATCRSARSSTPSAVSSRSPRWSGSCCCCRSTSPSAATCGGCAPGWSASPSYATEELRPASRPSTTPRPSSSELLGPTVVAEPRGQPGDPVRRRCPAATRVTHERPALERITMERAALEPHPRWRRFVGRVTQPRVLVAIGAIALLLGGGAIYASQQLLSDDEGPRGPHVGAIDPADVKVAVLNGTSINGLAGKVSSDLDSSGYEVGRDHQHRRRGSRRPWSSTPTAEAGGAEGRRRPRGQEGGRAGRPRHPRARRRRRRRRDRGRGQGLALGGRAPRLRRRSRSERSCSSSSSSPS